MAPRTSFIGPPVIAKRMPVDELEMKFGMSHRSSWYKGL